MKWYFAFNGRVAGWLNDLIRAAVLSARAHTNLEPHCIYDGEPKALTSWLQDQGVPVHFSQVPFVDELYDPGVIARNAGTGYLPEAARGFYLPFAIPQVEQSDEFVLFTDCDVFFTGAVDLSTKKPRVLAAVPEVSDLTDPLPSDQIVRGFNSGVMLLNVSALRERLPQILATLRAHHFFKFASGAIYDQGVLNAVFQDEWEALSPIYNWRAFWEPNEAARIIHFHGPKPQQILAVLEGRDDVVVSQANIDLIRQHEARYRGSLGQLHGALTLDAR